MENKIRLVRKFNQRYKNFSFSELMTKADEEYLEATIEMDEKGNVLAESKFDKLGELEERNSLIYSTEGKLLEHSLYYAMDDVTEKRVLKRDEKGKLIEEVKIYGEEAGERTAIDYNEQGLILCITEFDEEGVFVSKEQITYDKEGNVIERVKSDESGNLIEKILFENVSEKKLYIEKEFSADGELDSVTTVTLNEKGKEISSYKSNPSGKLISGILTNYDEQGNILERIYKEEHSRTVKYEYDENNRMIAQELSDNSGLLLRKNIYEYDDKGNLISEQTFEMDNARGNKEKHFGTRYEYEYFS